MAGERTAHFFRILYIILFVFTGLLIVNSIDPSMFNYLNILNILDYLLLVIQLIIQGLGEVVYYIVQFIVNSKAFIPFIGPGDALTGNSHLPTDQVLAQFLQTIKDIFNPINKLFPHSRLLEELFPGEEVDFSKLSPDQIDLVISSIQGFFASFIILILTPMAFVSGIGFLREGDTKLAIYSFLGFQLMLIIAILFGEINIAIEIDSTSLVSMILSPIFTLGFLLYLLLELAFQTSFVLNIIEPMTDREKRINENLKRIKTYVPQASMSDSAIQSVQSNKHGILAASYLREMVERRMFKKGEKQLDEKSTMRLQSYIASLNVIDPLTEEKLAAKTAQPDADAIIKHFIPSMIIRMFLVIILAYTIISPQDFITFLFSGSFPQLIDSLELSQPEFSTIAIMNVVFGFFLIGYILSYFTKGRSLEIGKRVIQQIETLVDFDRGETDATVAPSGQSVGEADDTDEEETLD